MSLDLVLRQYLHPITQIIIVDIIDITITVNQNSPIINKFENLNQF